MVSKLQRLTIPLMNTQALDGFLRDKVTICMTHITVIKIHDLDTPNKVMRVTLCILEIPKGVFGKH